MEDNILDLILDIARKDENIRIVAMNGSRVDRNREKDRFQDYDMVYLVRNLKDFRLDNFLKNFSQLAILQEPGPPSLFENSWSYLIQFIDGSRIDLRIIEELVLEEYLKEDSLTKILMDKDGRIKEEIIPSDKDFWIKRPEEKEYNEVCNEFLWISLYIGKGLARNKFIYSRKHLDENFRPMLIKVLEWKVGIEKGFNLTLGKYGEELKKYLDIKDWSRLMESYDDGDSDKVWDILFLSLDFFKEIAIGVGEEFSYSYPKEDHENVLSLLKDRKLDYLNKK